LDEAVNFLTAGPVGRAAALGRFVSKFNFRKEFGDKVYTKLSRALSAQKPEELRDVLDMLRRSKSYTDYMTSVKNFAGGRGASVAGTVVPTVVEERGFAPAPSAEIDPAAEAKAAEEDAAAEADGLAYSSGEEVPVEEETTAPTVPPEGIVTINGRNAQLGEDGMLYYVDDGSSAEGISMGMYRGGSVQAFKTGGNKGEKKRGYDYGNAARTFGQGLTFGTADEAEGFVRSLLSGRSYKDERDEIRKLQERYALANPNTALALEGAGMIGGSMLVPSLGAARAVASAPRAVRFVAGGLDDLAQGAAYGAGKAKEWADIAGDIRKDALGNTLAYTAASGAGAGAKAGGRYLAGKAASTKPGYQAAMTLKRLMSKY
jgi:hypothetical protein